MTSKTIELCQELMARRSITPDDDGCQDLLSRRLSEAGFEIERLNFGEVTNLWARLGDKDPILCFAGHTDVVPPGPDSEWLSPPFTPTVRDGLLYGRGAADMKSAIAAMTVAAETFGMEHKSMSGSLALLITSDEEGIAADGTVKVVETLSERQEQIRWCVVGEPSSQTELGDLIRIGRRGSLTGYLTVKGVQGHVAYPNKAQNPIHKALPALDELCRTQWDTGNKHFPPTGFQIPQIQAGTATNVIPGALDVVMNFRFCTESTAQSLKQRTEEILLSHELDYDLNWHLSGQPFLTQQTQLIDIVTETIESKLGRTPELSTGGGTSDGRFIAPTGAQVVELGVVNKTIHKTNECVRLDDIEHLTNVYLEIMRRLLR